MIAKSGKIYHLRTDGFTGSDYVMQHILDLSIVPLSTSMRSNPHKVLVASFCMTSAWTPAERDSVCNRFTVLISIVEVG